MSAVVTPGELNSESTLKVGPPVPKEKERNVTKKKEGLPCIRYSTI
jgi:hypothetical protein